MGLTQFDFFKWPCSLKNYLTSEPFPHVVIDDAFEDVLIEQCYRDYPAIDPYWWKYQNPLEVKFTQDRWPELPKSFVHLISILSSSTFLYYLENLTGIKGLMADTHLNGGGLHQITKGGKLDIHADYNFHPITGFCRRLNVLIYFNKSWDPSWKGHLELWNKDMSQCVKSISPIFNRMVIFTVNDKSFHGHPDPLDCPDHVTRKSLALYYYTFDRPVWERSNPHSTLYQKRPQDPYVAEIAELRLRRAERRL